MSPAEYNEDLIISGMKTWNKLSEMIDPDEAKQFDDISEFETFYMVVMSKLLEVEEAD